MKTKIQTMLKMLSVAAMLVVSVAQAEITIQPSVSGAWVTGSSGQGIMINVSRVDDVRTIVLIWNTYVAGEQLWMFGVGKTQPGDTTVEIPLSITSGGDWGLLHNSDNVVSTEWGVAELSFQDCDNGALSYTSQLEGFDSGTVDIIRITDTEGLSCMDHPASEGLKQEAADSLKFMREEEKLARDTYYFMYDLWGNRIFTNISNSESQHMSTLLTLMDNYGVEDSASTVIGEFNDPILQDLYDTLTLAGSASLLDAYLVGALIEEVDIRDLVIGKEAVAEYADIDAAYDNLLCGSRNHLRSYVKQITGITGQAYEVQIPELAEDVAAILASDMEQCGAN